MTGRFVGVLQVEFGDWGADVGRMAMTLAPVRWVHGTFRVTIPAGTITDGASVPRPLWWLLPPWGDAATLPAVLHDYLCTRLDEGRPVPGCSWRAACDWQFCLALMARGIPAWRALLVWALVRLHSIGTGKH